jgi:hypothetical protein
VVPQGTAEPRLGITALLCFKTSALEGVRVIVTPRPLSTSGKGPVPITQEGGWAAGPVWTVAENITPPGI